MKTRKITNLITTSVMASALIFSYGGSAFANEDTTGTALTAETNTEIVSNVTTEGAQEGTTNIEEATTKATATITSDTITVETGEQIEEAPALVPGDFFYFVKTFMEKIRLAVTLDDYKEAQLLAEFATERIAEANALIAQGKTEEAAKLLQEAIATQETASEVLDQTKEEATNDVAQEDAEKVTEEATEEDTNETTATTEDTVEVEESVADEEVVAVESKIGNNIVALLAAVEKIDNPRAQEALMKNIEKSFAKLSKKIQKLEEKNGTEDVTTEEVATEEDTTNENKVEEATVKNSVEGEANTSTEKQEIADVEVEEVEEETTVVAPVKAVKTEKTQKESVQAKQQAVKAKVEEKKNQVQAKVEEKKQAVKAKVEQKRNENANKDKE